MSGTIMRVAGPVVTARNLHLAHIYDVVRVGCEGLVGEVIRLEDETATIQVYEDTNGLRVGEPVANTGSPLQVELGPGLLGSIYDGLQRPLPALLDHYGPWLSRGLDALSLSRQCRWTFKPQVSPGQAVSAGDILGTVQETPSFEHRILVPPGMAGTVAAIEAGDFDVETLVAWIKGEDGIAHEVRMLQQWPVRQARPIRTKLEPTIPLVSGQRVIDALFPIARGGAALIPGGFGTGKTVLEQSLAKWIDADVVVYIGCGERGNEMTEVLAELPRLVDPRTGSPLMQRTVLVANTSNMPVAAREASIYTGITIAEYFRDMGYDVALLADSTSRWGEALREVSGRLEEMPGEEGYPAYLGSRLADFYERAGRVVTLSQPERRGSVTVVGAVSPPGGDFSEPMTQASLRVTGVFWGLNTGLARRRHFPAIDWHSSYSLYNVKAWFDTEVAAEWSNLVSDAMALLQQEEALLEIVQLVGADALPEGQRAVLAVARRLREDFLQQSAFDSVDAFCPLSKTYVMLRAILSFGHALHMALDRGMPLEEALARPEADGLSFMKYWPPDTAQTEVPRLIDEIAKAFGVFPGETHDA